MNTNQINERVIFDKDKINDDVTSILICIKIKEGLPKYLKFANLKICDAETNTLINQWQLGKYINESANNLLVCCRL